MKQTTFNFRSVIASAVLGSLIMTQAAEAKPSSKKSSRQSSQSATSSGSSSSSSGSAGLTLQINPENLRSHILNGNTSVLTALNNVYQAKASVNKSRGDLLPSVNLGVGLSPSFALTSFSFLLPFLVPSNWYNLDASKHQLTANGYAFYISELNAYASALSVYMTIEGDYEMRAVYKQQYDNYSQIYDVVAAALRVGAETATDLAQAASQKENARIQLSQMDELLIQETASIRSMLALPIETKITFATYHFPALAKETDSPASVFRSIQSSTPERNQIASLIAAAKDEKWATAWGFLGGPNVNVSTGQGSAAFGSLSSGVPLNLGFGIFPSVVLSSLNIEQLQIRQKEIDLEEQSTIETAWGSITEANLQLEQGILAEADAQKVFDDTLVSYRLGTTDLLHVIQAANTQVQSGVARAKAQSDVDNQRINLNRVLMSNQFKSIPSCDITLDSQGGGGIFGFFKRIFQGSKAVKVSVDDLCRAKS